jgi:hypothetical protein
MEPASGPLRGTAGQKVFLFFGYAEIPSRFLSWCGNCEGDPPFPPEGEAAQGGKPPRPPRAVGFFSTLPRSTAMLHGARPDEAVRARGPIAIRYWSPLRFFNEHDFYRANFFVNDQPWGRPIGGGGVIAIIPD